MLSTNFRRRFIMRYAAVAIAVLATVLFAVAPPSNAGDLLALKNGIIASVQSGNLAWRNCGSVSFTAPSAGAAVVTASGQAIFNGNDFRADLYLTISKTANSQGPWVYGITPGTEPVQTYTVVRAFTGLKANQTVVFYLNGSSANGTNRAISVQTGTMAVEFYPTSKVVAQAPGQEPVAAPEASEEPTPDNVISNVH
jgi:hypothetical protein